MPLPHFLQLSLTQGIGPILIRRLIDSQGSADKACRASIAQLRAVEGIGTTRAEKIFASLKEAQRLVEPELQKARDLGVQIICPEDDAYPPLLKSIPDPPAVLYVNGALEPRDLNALAIVGSRKCSFYGREQAERFAALLAAAGFTVVSGGARGVDSAAHRGALQHPQGRTVAVLGCGLDLVYPPENKDLFNQIVQRGAVLSEYPLGTPPLAENFPRRNRIISGTSRGVLVVEADERSGALVTARQAADDHNRPVFALPGRADNPLSAGPHKLIRDGATLAANLEHILEGLGPLPHDLTQPSLFPEGSEDSSFNTQDSLNPQSPHLPTPAFLPSLTDRQQAILSALSSDPASIDALVDRTFLAPHEILQEMTLLTLKGQVARVDGQTFVRRKLLKH
jgi:DNA processing protein